MSEDVVTVTHVTHTLRAIWPEAAFIASGIGGRVEGVQNARGTWLVDASGLEELDIDIAPALVAGSAFAFSDPKRPFISLIRLPSCECEPCAWCKSSAILSKAGSEMICTVCRETIARMDILSALSES